MTFFELTNKFPNDKAVIDHFVKIRYNGTPCCLHCASVKVYPKHTEPKNFYCNDCHNTFSIFKDTIFEKSSTDLVKWMYAIHLFLNGKKGISGLQLMREIGVTYKTAWRMLRQIRLAMGNEQAQALFTNIVEMDEVYIGGHSRRPNDHTKLMNKKDKRSLKDKTAVIGVVDRDKKKVHAEVSKTNGKSGDEFMQILQKTTEKGSTLMTDAHYGYRASKHLGYKHLFVDHTTFYSKNGINNNTIESFWAILQRGIYGVYHQVSPKHL